MSTAKKAAPDTSASVDTATRIVPVEYIERRIYLLREQKVMLDSDLADLYQVTTGNLNLAVKRNRIRFPADFMFQLTKDENASLVLQSAIAKRGRDSRAHRRNIRIVQPTPQARTCAQRAPLVSSENPHVSGMRQGL